MNSENKEKKRRKIIKLSDYPTLVKEFDFSSNELKPEDISFQSGIKVHWVCTNGHKWEDSPAHRVGENRGCPYCNGSKLWRGFNDFQTKYPEISKEWLFEKNEKLPSDYLFTCSKEKVWWKCSRCGNEYLMSIRSRGIEHQGCPICAHKKMVKNRNESFGYKFPVLSKEWDFEKNQGKSPFNYYPCSNEKFWWKCKNGHSWESTIANRVQNGKGSGCPICSNRLIVKGINDLATLRPDLMKYWDFEKNTILPYEISEKSYRKVWWKCEKNHSFETKVYLFGMGKIENLCPVCSNRKVITGFNDVATTNPELLSEWDYEKNIFLPTEIHGFNSRKVWWKCSKGHSWSASIVSRTHNKKGCPYCSNQKLLIGYNDTATLYPEILKFWDYEKNDSKPEDFIGKYSNKTAYFKCEHGHSWKSKIAVFCKGGRCPVCSNRKILAGYNDLETSHPELAKEWNYRKNLDQPSEFSFGSDKKVWWKCNKGHEWKASISSRARGNGCPYCAKEKQVSLPEKIIYFYIKQYFPNCVENVYLKELKGRELDIYIPSLKLGIEYDGQKWHKSIERDLIKDGLCKTAGIKLIRIREENCPKYNSDSIKIDCNDIHNNAFLLKPTIYRLFEEINRLFNLSVAAKIEIEKDYSQINSLLITSEKENSLLNTFPEIAKEWNFDKNGIVSPDQIAPFSNRRVWWICPKGHEWIAPVGSRTRKNKNGCPVCGNKKLLKGYNDLKTRFPLLAKEWDYENNYPLTPDSIIFNKNIKVWWICPKGHHYKASINTRERTNSGCNVCSGLKPDVGKNDLLTLYPEVAKEWDYNKNFPLGPNDIVPGSEKKVWWVCPHGHSYQALPRSRTKLGSGCPVCYKEKRKKKNDKAGTSQN